MKEFVDYKQAKDKAHDAEVNAKAARWALDAATKARLITIEMSVWDAQKIGSLIVDLYQRMQQPTDPDGYVRKFRDAVDKALEQP